MDVARSPRSILRPFLTKTSEKSKLGDRKSFIKRCTQYLLNVSTDGAHRLTRFGYFNAILFNAKLGRSNKIDELTRVSYPCKGSQTLNPALRAR